MKKTMTAVAILTLGASLAVAAPESGKRHHGKKGGHERMQAHMAQKLNLTETQQEQLRELREQFQRENAPLRASMQQTRTDFRAARQAGDTARADVLRSQMERDREAMKQRMTAQHERVNAILTAEQRAQLEAMKAERMEKRGQRGTRSQRGPGGFQRGGTR